MASTMWRISAFLCRFSLLTLCVALLASHANAAESEETVVQSAETVAEQPAAVKPEPVKPEPELLAVLDAPRDYLSEKIVGYSKGIDEFFGDERYFQEHNKSVIQFDMSQTLAQGGNKNFLFEGRAKLDFPSASRRFQLVLESKPEQKATGEIKKDLPETPKEGAKPEQYAASVRYEKAEESRWHYSANLGAQFQFPLDPFARTRVSYSLPLGEWRLKLAENVFWFSTIGLGQTAQFDVERVLSQPLLFRATTTATCLESTQICNMRQDFSLFHTLNERAAMLYQASAIGADKPVLQQTAYVLLAKYRYRLHREWVFYEVSPQLHFPRADNFKPNALLLLRLEILLGGTR